MKSGEEAHDHTPAMKEENPPKKRSMLTVAQYQDRLRRRFYRTLDYISIAVSLFLIYLVFLGMDYLLILAIDYFFQSEMKDSPFLATAFKATRIGLALLTFILFVIHSIRAAIDQYQRDIQLATEDEKPHV